MDRVTGILYFFGCFRGGLFLFFVHGMLFIFSVNSVVFDFHPLTKYIIICIIYHGFVYHEIRVFPRLFSLEVTWRGLVS